MAEEKGFSYETRIKFGKECYSSWRKSAKGRIGKLSDDKKKLFDVIEGFGRSYQESDKALKDFYAGYCLKILGKNEPDRMEYDFQSDKFSLSHMMKDELADIVDIFVPSELADDYYRIIDEFVTYQYSTGYTRRTVRTHSLSRHYLHAFKLLYCYASFGFFHVSVDDYIAGRLTEEQKDYIHNSYGYGDINLKYVDDMIAARINAGDERVIAAIKDAILSENNTVIVSTEMIRGVIKGKNTELHKLLLQYLLAAKLQEGVRQAICENADCGRADAFMTLLQGIHDEKLMRFASVKRAMATWTGFIYEESCERVGPKVMEGMLSAMKAPAVVEEMLASNDSVRIMTALWTLGSYEVADAVRAMISISKDGTKNQIMTCAYYDRILQSARFEREFSYPMMEKYQNDPEIVAALLPCYLPNPYYALDSSCKYRDPAANRYNNPEAEIIYQKIPVTVYFDHEDEARKHYRILKDICQGMTKKKVIFSPSVFPWNSEELTKSDLIERMGLIAYILQDDDLIDEICGMLTDIDGNHRNVFIETLLHEPHNDHQKKALIAYVADKESYSRKAAYILVKRLALTPEDYQMLEGYLKYKTEDIRTNVIKLLGMQDEDGLRATITRLLASANSLIRIAGLDLIKTTCFDAAAQTSEDKKNEYRKLVQDTVDVNTLTQQERILYDGIAGKHTSVQDVLGKPGYGLYDPNEEICIISETDINTKAEKTGDNSAGSTNKKSLLGSLKNCFKISAKVSVSDSSELRQQIQTLKDYFDIPAKELDRHFKELEDFLDAHASLEYKSAGGDSRILGNGLYILSYGRTEKYHESYPFPELWKEFYETYIHSEKLFWNLYFACQSSFSSDERRDYVPYREAERKILPCCGSDYHIPDGKHYSNSNAHNDYSVVLDCIRSIFDFHLDRTLAVAFCRYAADISDTAKWLPGEVSFLKSEKFSKFLTTMSDCHTDDEYREWFEIYRMLDLAYEFPKHITDSVYNAGQRNHNLLSVEHYIKAYTLGQISANSVYKYAFEGLPLIFMVEALGKFAPDAVNYRDLLDLQPFMAVNLKEKTCDTDCGFYCFGQEMYLNVMNLILNVELKRGDSETLFSKAGRKLRRVYGVERLSEILAALGKDVLDRNTYYSYYSNGAGRRECLCSLLQKSYPDKEDTAEAFRNAMHQKGISDDRVIEVAMYAPQWMELAEAYLGCDGFRSGCYYFMAHMNESFDNKKKAVIAKYTPLDAEELNAGAFDLKWFFECYNRLGENMFGRLYKAAKYISDGAKHARARKYADAALGKVTLEELEKQVEDKRNKDVLMSCGIVPIRDKADVLHRYEFFQKFLKESRQFGAQRRASEAKAVEMALRNLATTAGYADSLRLTLAMETELVRVNDRYFEGISIGEYVVTIAVDENGAPNLSVEKNGKQIKSVPAALKKDDDFLGMKEFYAKLKDQYSRSVKMFEKSMEERETYSLSELLGLCENPVTRAIIHNLIWTEADENKTGQLYRIGNEGTLLVYDSDEFCTNQDKAEQNGADDSLLRIAHPYDLFKSGKWSALMQTILKQARESGRMQPFKQVFRELYVKLPEEEENNKSRMFAGNQIQPQKTVGVLKNRGWIADYEDGLQKIYYKDNIIATIYALADWFSPSDIEAPTLEYVAFYNRKSFEPMKLGDVPDIVYSEVMRDVDLAVSVAHVGGVDPETSHSTIEMRKVICEFNAKLFKLSNVHFEGTHAYIDGKYGKYTIQLGSGVIHKMGSHMIHVLPVHSQSRGKLFLPFIDEDPKTAEIMSKILLFAQDDKIKDPYIMDQILME